MEHYSAAKNNGIKKFEGKWMKLGKKKNNILSPVCTHSQVDRRHKAKQRITDYNPQPQRG